MIRILPWLLLLGGCLDPETAAIQRRDRQGKLACTFWLGTVKTAADTALILRSSPSGGMPTCLWLLALPAEQP